MQPQMFRTFAYVAMLLVATSVFSQTVVNGDCITVSGGAPNGPYVLTLDVAKCPPAFKNNNMTFPSLTFPVYADINGRVTTLDAKINTVTADAIETIKKTVDGQALKADDVARIVKQTRDQIYTQLQNDLKKAVQEAVTQAIKDQIASEVTNQLEANKNKQPSK